VAGYPHGETLEIAEFDIDESEHIF